LDIKDESTTEIVEFGVNSENDNPSDILPQISPLWKFSGKLLIISTPYRKGVHYATHPGQFIPIIEALERLHLNGFVHGDIRAYNMVHGEYDEETEKWLGWLIDYDLGGKAYEVTYPIGYKTDLADGAGRGTAKFTISMADDWRALYTLMPYLYEWEFPTVDEKEQLKREANFALQGLTEAISLSIEAAEGINGQTAEEFRNPLITEIAYNMKEYISHLVQFHYIPKLAKNFKRNLMMNNFISFGPAEKDVLTVNTKSAAATYSPPNK
jgi:hypothetical protein